MSENLGQRLKRLRQSRRMTIEEVASQIGVATSTYREWEYGREIRGEPYEKLADVFGVGLIELMKGKNPTKIRAFKAAIEIEKNTQIIKKELSDLL